MNKKMARQKQGRGAHQDLIRFPIIRVMAAASALLIILGASCATTEPNLTVMGVVKDAESGQPLAGATVSDDGYGTKPYRSATTDPAGRYQYRTWPEEHNIIALAPGYRAQRLLLKTSLWRKEKEIELNFALVRD